MKDNVRTIFEIVKIKIYRAIFNLKIFEKKKYLNLVNIKNMVYNVTLYFLKSI
jgi:hypothetical protein